MLCIAGLEFRSLANQMHATIVSITDRDRLFTPFYVPPPHFSHKLILLVFHPITPAVCVIHYPPMSTGREVLVSRIQRRHSFGLNSSWKWTVRGKNRNLHKRLLLKWKLKQNERLEG